ARWHLKSWRFLPNNADTEKNVLAPLLRYYF
ncbi:MAG: hypothetical protein ACI9JT_001990, partial [Polaribacter sp.]